MTDFPPNELWELTMESLDSPLAPDGCIPPGGSNKTAVSGFMAFTMGLSRLKTRCIKFYTIYNCHGNGIDVCFCQCEASSARQSIPIFIRSDTMVASHASSDCCHGNCFSCSSSHPSRVEQTIRHKQHNI